MKLRVSIFALLAFVLASTALVGCGSKGNDSVDADGNCTSSFVSDHNKVRDAFNEWRFTSSYSTPSDVNAKETAVKNACANFYAKHGSNTCTEGTGMQAPTPELTNVCKSFTQATAVTPKNTTQPQPPAQPAPVTKVEAVTSKGDTLTISLLQPGELKAKILDAYNVQRADGSPKVLAKGRLDSPEEFGEEARAGAASCFFKNDPKATFLNGTTFTLQYTEEKPLAGRPGSRILALIFEDQIGQQLVMRCVNVVDATFKVKNVREAVLGTLELTVTK